MDFGNIKMSFDPDMNRVASALLSEDDIGAVIRCHFEAERAVEHVLMSITNGRYGFGKLTYKYLSDKVKLLKVLGVPPHFLVPLERLNKHRNQFAHEGLEQIANEQALELRDAVKLLYPVFDDNFRMTLHGKREFDKCYRDCSTKERYVVSSTVAMSLIAAFPEMVMAASTQAAASEGATMVVHSD